ncbi:undecaprenyl-diphosphatase [Ectothiorhodospira magna]|uniref:Undecaprenyl-diphosphatase n=1 Tax=Ectothiorhodospira magna TaxID=867345 RepID=A0A1H9EVM3_9GAMM|nr:undecaprenyl-diphosphate phosphatase [Ectothiorhodospira magna]SEQ29637.1 undecaprenyl-diphosphatase [Ectothiorhodospira magna]
MDLFQTLVLALVQGLTEFLPISSAAHLILVPELTAWEDQGLTFDVATHVGSLVAVIVYFRAELRRMATHWAGSLVGRGFTPDAKLAWAVGLGTIPAGLAGLLFHDVISTSLRSVEVIIFTTIIFALLLGLADWVGRRRRDEYQIGWLDVLVIGLAQALALIPGVSRSGATMTAALFMGFNRQAAARYSFLLSIPIIALAGGYETWGLIQAPEENVAWSMILIGALVAGVSAYLCIHLFLKLLARMSFLPFVVYRLLLGAFLIFMFW